MPTKVTSKQAADCVAFVLCLAEDAGSGRDRVNELRLGDAVVRDLVALAEAIKAN